MTSFSETTRWIGAANRGQMRDAPLLRCDFEIDGEILSATLLICGLGCYEAFINGRRVGDHVLDPAQSDYDRRAFYVRHDVTGLVRVGGNAVGVMLGDGWFCQGRVWTPANRRHRMSTSPCYGEPMLQAEIQIERTDGTRLVVGSGEAWKVMPGPITESNIYAGECYDARLECPGWDEPGFDASTWQPARIIEAPCENLQEQPLPPMRRIEEIRPIAIRETTRGCFIADMGQNFAGWVKISVDGPAGREIRLRFAETLDTNGHLDSASTGFFATDVEQVDRFICDGRGRRTWEPRFTYHGFRFVEVLGWPGVPTPEEIVGVVVHTDLPPAGAFACSVDRLNVLHRMAIWTHRSNIHGLPEDCPARERCGWLGDANLVAEYSMWNFQARAFWKKYLDDIETTRSLRKGLPGVIAPGRRNYPGRPDWSAAYVMLPWYLYLFYGQSDAIASHREGMCRLMDHFAAEAEDWILTDGFGDWYDVGGEAICQHTPPALTSTLWFLRCAQVMAEMSAVLDQTEDAKRYGDWAGRIKAAIVKRWYDVEAGTFGSQTADAMALAFHTVAEEYIERVVASLVADIHSRGDHLSTGIMGVRFLFEVLTRHGHGELALRILLQDTYPGFGDMIRRGATTLWEWWGEPEHDKRTPRSHNHPMMGGFDNWFFNTLGGIQPDPAEPGFAHVLLEPRVVTGIDWVRVHHDSPRGRIESNWTYAEGRFAWQVVVPPGSRATAKLPLTGRVESLTAGCHELVDET